jgi:hypothetical protein
MTEKHQFYSPVYFHDGIQATKVEIDTSVEENVKYSNQKELLKVPEAFKKIYFSYGPLTLTKNEEVELTTINLLPTAYTDTLFYRCLQGDEISFDCQFSISETKRISGTLSSWDLSINGDTTQAPTFNEKAVYYFDSLKGVAETRNYAVKYTYEDNLICAKTDSNIYIPLKYNKKDTTQAAECSMTLSYSINKDQFINHIGQCVFGMINRISITMPTSYIESNSVYRFYVKWSNYTSGSDTSTKTNNYRIDITPSEDANRNTVYNNFSITSDSLLVPIVK